MRSRIVLILLSIALIYGLDDTAKTKDTGQDKIKFNGFNGQVSGGLLVHPDGKHLIYPSGSDVIIQDISKESDQYVLLSGHTDNVTAIAVSNDGRFIVSGQKNKDHLEASMILWDYSSKKRIHTWKLQRLKILALAFSNTGKYIFSVGDGGSIVVWDMDTKVPISGAKGRDMTKCLATSKVKDEVFVTGGQYGLEIWEFNKFHRKVHNVQVNMGGLKRAITSIEVIDDEDESKPYAFSGTTTGDILCFSITSHTLLFQAPSRHNHNKIFPLGISSLAFVKMAESGFNFLIGTNTGIVGYYELSGGVKALGEIKNNTEPWKLDDYSAGRISSIATRRGEDEFFVGTGNSHVYKASVSNFSFQLVATYQAPAVKDSTSP